MLLAVGACSDRPTSSPRLDTVATRPVASFVAGECVASFRMITFEEDALRAAYDWGLQSDTVDVCESWMGSDYSWKFVTVGTSDRAGGVYDMARDVSYQNGMMNVTDQGVVVLTQPIEGANLLDAFATDPGLRAAVYDDPYYAIRALGGEVNDRVSAGMWDGVRGRERFANLVGLDARGTGDDGNSRSTAAAGRSQNGRPYSYAWFAGAQYLGASMEATFANNGYAFYLNLSVTDAAGRSATASRSVAVSAGAPQCYF
ncbi:MAG TPA: hypothetical protein VFT29_07440 [Gemmatimonadaceae bacterium]|nr:hypothetical protein [Gemmatimonadaceae bacterium]